jgi:hypothetical protein
MWKLFWALGLLLAGCSPKAQLQVSYGEWEPLEPGAPALAGHERPTVRQVLRAGTGPALAIGDVAELRLQTAGATPPEVRRWVWIGFLSGDGGAFSTGRSEFQSSLIGQPVGSVLTFNAPAVHATEGYAGGVGVLLFGGARDPFGGLSATPEQKQGTPVRVGPVETVVEILRVCNGPVQQRQVTLFDDSAIYIAQDLGRVFETREPRRRFLREARWEGRCAGGVTARFRFGPVRVDPPPGQSEGLRISTPFDAWEKQAWQQVPLGVVLH